MLKLKVKFQSLIQKEFKENFLEMLRLTMRIKDEDLKIESDGENEDKHYSLIIRQNNITLLI